MRCRVGKRGRCEPARLQKPPLHTWDWEEGHLLVQSEITF